MKKSNRNEVAPKARSESAMVAVSKSSHVISKFYCAAKEEGRRSSKYLKQKIVNTPMLRIVYVYEPETIITDPQNFRSLVQKLTRKPPHKSKEKKKQTNPSGPSYEVACAEVGTENVQDTLYSNGQMPIMENVSTKFFIDESSGYSKAFYDRDMIVPGLRSHGLLHKNAPVCDNVQDHFYSNNQMPIIEKTSTFFSIEDYSGCSEALNDTGIIFSCLVNEELLEENPLVWNNSPFCDMYNATGACNGLEDW